MPFTSTIAACVACSLGLLLSAAARSTESLDRDWSFQQGDPAGAEKPDFDHSAWRKLDVPHDWSIEGTFDRSAATTGSGGWLPSGVAWYRKEISIAAESQGKRTWVEFDGVMANSDVWINGHHLGHRPNGYVSFRYDLTDHLRPGAANLLAVRSDTSAQPASRWYSGAGIYRHVRLVTVDPIHVEPWGVHVTTPAVGAEKATVKIQTSVRNSTGKPAEINVITSILGPDGKSLATSNTPLSLAENASKSLSQEIEISQPALWNLESPQLHKLVTQISSGEVLLDETTTPFGVRQAEFRSATGFWLNGKNLKLKGVCLHHDGGAVGAAVPLAVWERRLISLRDLGVNAIRTAHNPPAPEFLDLCDRMGFLVMDEFFDCWTKGKNPEDYHKHFKQWAHTDLRDGILRDRNHPSVILYSVGNEIHDTPHPEIAKPILRALVDICHATDPSRPVTQALFRPNVSGDYTNGLADMLDVIGTNYRDQELLQAWKDKGGRKIIGTEQGHDRSTWAACRDHAEHAGQFLWVGIDYLGESRSWPVTVFNGGLLDRAGFLQPRGAERQSWWSERPMVRIFRRIAATEETPADPGYEALEWKRRQVLFPDWTPVNQATHEENVEVYTNASQVELFLNDQSLGKKSTRGDGAALNWKVAYQSGTLKAIARDSQGVEVAADTVRTAGPVKTIALLSDRRRLGSGWDDVSHVEVQLLDENGTLVPNSDAAIHFKIKGPGKIVALDSGSIISTERFQSTERKTFQGRALAIIRGTSAGKISLTAKSANLPTARVGLTVTD